MMREAATGDGADDAVLRLQELIPEHEGESVSNLDAHDDDDEDGDDDFELDTMEDDDEDDDEMDDDDDHEELEEVDEEQEQDEDPEQELSALEDLLDGAIDETETAAQRDDTIAHRTRTKLSLVNVELDLLESLLPPDPAEGALFSAHQGDEYQRFLSSLLPTLDEEDNLSFLDEEGEEYRPDEEEDDDDDDDDEEQDEGGENGQRRRNRRTLSEEDDQQSVRVSKKELTELLWDSTQVKVPPTFPKSPRVPHPGSWLLANGTLSDATASTSTTGNKTLSVAAAEGGGVSDMGGKIDDLKDAAAMKDMHGTISQEQCIQLASQMHKHFQLLLQTYHLIANDTEGKQSEKGASDGEGEGEREGEAADEDGSISKPKSAQPTSPLSAVANNQLQQCEQMLRDLQIRGKRALLHKARLLSKLTLSSTSASTSSGTADSAASTTNADSATTAAAAAAATTTASSERLEHRRVTRSISAAHAAVAHPSMFDIVGSQSTEQLTSKFKTSCSISERNHAVQASLQELDKHILLSRKKKKGRPPSVSGTGNGSGRNSSNRETNAKTVFSSAEDRLLLQGVKRHGVQSDAWVEIQQTLIPTKEVKVLSKRYRYLASKRKRGGAKEFKLYHSEHHARRKALWMIEEDVRIARGVVEYFGDNRRFARIARKYLPHRHRLEVRKRWERLKERYRLEDGSVIEVDASVPGSAVSWSPASRVFAAAVKQFLEAIYRRQAKEPLMAEVTRQTKAMLAAGQQGTSGSASVNRPDPQSQASTATQPQPTQPAASCATAPTGCRVKNLHPALFFSSWAVINPAILLERTCEHNWPAFIEHKRGGDGDDGDSSESTLVLVSRTAVSRVEQETARHRRRGDEAASMVDNNRTLAAIQEEVEDLDFSLDPLDSGGEDDGDEEDSEFEREELLSSESGGSDSEYELMEMSDDDGDNDDQSLEDDDRAQGHHTLSLENLRRTGGNSRAKRALEALERRITGGKNAASAATATTTMSGFHVAPSPRPADRDASEFESFTVDDGGLDLFAYEELSDSPSTQDGDEEQAEEEEADGDFGDEDDEDDEDGFERDELRGSSEDESDSEPLQGGTAVDRTKRSRDGTAVHPPKRVRLHAGTPRCTTCGSSPCVCASTRMERLLRRMQPRGGEPQFDAAHHHQA